MPKITITLKQKYPYKPEDEAAENMNFEIHVYKNAAAGLDLSML